MISPIIIGENMNENITKLRRHLKLHEYRLRMTA
jgi:hypothetical protein